MKKHKYGKRKIKFINTVHNTEFTCTVPKSYFFESRGPTVWKKIKASVYNVTKPRRRPLSTLFNIYKNLCNIEGCKCGLVHQIEIIHDSLRLESPSYKFLILLQKRTREEKSCILQCLPYTWRKSKILHRENYIKILDQDINKKYLPFTTRYYTIEVLMKKYITQEEKDSIMEEVYEYEKQKEQPNPEV